MALGSMIAELQGAVPGVDASNASTLLNEAWEGVRRLGGWSFQFGQTGFNVPGCITTGTVSLTFGSADVVGDMTASTAWQAGTQYGSLFTQRQFRSGGIAGTGTIYDIIAFDGVSTLTLDRPYIDTITTTLGGYCIYQPYIVAPVADFESWLSVNDVTNGGRLQLRGDRRQVDMIDPQRLIAANPDRLLSLGRDVRSGSATAEWQRYELWPHPYTQFLYQAWYLRFGDNLTSLSDTLPYGIPESLVKAAARVRCYEQAEANKDPQNTRGAGADYRFLMGMAQKQYKDEIREARLRDRDRVDIFNYQMHRNLGGGSVTSYDAATGGVRAQVGAY